MHILVTGCAGFIGFHVCDMLLQKGHEITGIDNFENNYSVFEKEQNIEDLERYSDFYFKKLDILNYQALREILINNYDLVIHLAGLPGVRESILKSNQYIQSNVIGTNNLISGLINTKTRNIIFASSSSVYGNNPYLQKAKENIITKPLSPYGVTKLACENLLYSYYKSYDFNVIIKRFHSVYGPRMRPDLVIRKFLFNVENDNPIIIYGHGDSSRDYTYIGDVTKSFEGSISLLNQDLNIYKTYNICSGRSISITKIIDEIRSICYKNPIIKYKQSNLMESLHTLGDYKKAERELGYYPSMSIRKGIEETYKWIRNNAYSNSMKL